MKAFEEYKTKDKAEKTVIKEDCNALFSDLTQRLAKHSRPGYAPEGMQVSISLAVVLLHSCGALLSRPKKNITNHHLNTRPATSK